MGDQPSTTMVSFQKVGHLGVEPRASWSQTRRASICTCIRCCVASNAADDSVGAYLPCQWAGRRSNPRLRFFRPPLDRLSYQPILGSSLLSPVPCRHEKRLDVCGDTEPSWRKHSLEQRVSHQTRIRRGIIQIRRAVTMDRGAEECAFVYLFESTGLIF